MEGWISLHRKILENPILNRSRKYSPFEAWIWLLLKANHKDNKFMLGSELVNVEKGSMITSQKKLCKQFRWGNSKLRSFLKVLQKDEMLLLKTTPKATWSKQDYKGTYKMHKEKLINIEKDEYLKKAKENAYRPDDQRKMTMDYIKGIGKKA